MSETEELKLQIKLLKDNVIDLKKEINKAEDKILKLDSDLNYADANVDQLEFDKKEVLELLCKLWISLDKQTEFDKEIYDLLKYEKKLPNYLTPYFLKPL